jgi:gamma-glutamyltranspeptidase/glutathione hydrolase
MFTTRPEIRGNFGVVASTHWLATAAGMAMLERGGNAFDAAVAVGFALQVCEPNMNGPGGEVPILLYDTSRRRVQALCGQGVAPAAATIERYRSLGLDLVPGDGLLATVVPGAFDAWMLLLRDYGTFGLGEVLEHAIAFAGNGCPLTSRIVETIAAAQAWFEDEWVTSADVYLPHGKPPVVGELFRNPVLAQTYRRLVAEAEAAGGSRENRIEAARKAWAEGFVAEAIDDFCRTTEAMDCSGRRHRGLLTGDDMARWRASIEEPTSLDYHGYSVCKMGPWSQGPVFLQQLALLKGFDVAGMDPLGAEFVHTVTECAKLAFADREKFYGDPNFVSVPIEALLSEEYNASRRRLVGREASLDFRPGTIAGQGGTTAMATRPPQAYPPQFDTMSVGEPTERERRGRGDTCHFDVIDRHGNMVSATPSGGWLHSSPVVPSLGFPLNSRAQMFWLEEGSMSALAPGRRPRTTLTPSFALKDGKPYLAFGTPGGDQQDQWSLTFFLRHAHFESNLQAVIEMPMFHTDQMISSFFPRQSEPGSLSLEDRFPKATVARLKRRGHRASVVDGWSLGRLSAAARENDGLLRVAANPRGQQGYASGR